MRSVSRIGRRRSSGARRRVGRADRNARQATQLVMLEIEEDREAKKK
jgi:hypothetical protein